ncbi:MAG: hypothetical protein KDD89_15615, partial [Anaerolineales bacterium]|nr:hypothetical protein [Anaerolineales bacterium]
MRGLVTRRICFYRLNQTRSAGIIGASATILPIPFHQSVGKRNMLAKVLSCATVGLEAELIE